MYKPVVCTLIAYYLQKEYAGLCLQVSGDIYSWQKSKIRDGIIIAW